MGCGETCSLDKGPMGITGECCNQTCWLMSADQSSLENPKEACEHIVFTVVPTAWTSLRPE